MSSYESLAGFYDRVMPEEEYRLWADCCDRLFRPRGIRTVLDLACGTGRLSWLLAERGYEVIGVDLSCDMLAVAASREAEVKYPPLFLNQALQELDLYGTVQAAICSMDGLNYLPEDMETVIGQDELMRDFGKGAFSFIIVEDMPAKDVSMLKEKIGKVDHVDTVIWYDSVADLSIPMEMLPDEVYNAFNSENSTMMAVFFDSSTSADVTMDAIREIRSVVGERCFVSGMSALVTDLKDLCEREEPIYVAIAVALATVAMLLFLDSWIAPFIFLLSIAMMISMAPPMSGALFVAILPILVPRTTPTALIKKVITAIIAAQITAYITS